MRNQQLSETLAIGGEPERVNHGPQRLAAVSLVIFAVIATGLFAIPDFMARQVVIAETERDAAIWQNRVMHLLSDSNNTFANAKLSAEDERALTYFVASSDIFRLRLFDSDGKLFWSSEHGGANNTRDIRQKDISKRPFFHSNLVQGLIFHETEILEAGTVDGFAVDNLGASYDEHAERTVSEIYAPVVIDNKLIGIVEHYRDITDRLAVSHFRLQVATAIVAAALALMWGIAVLSVVLFKRRNQELANRRRKQEHAILEYETRRSREVRLLSELNEWLQSCKSLDELFGMVSSILSRVFPESSGSLYVYSNSRDVLEGACNWHDCRLEDEIRPDDCWGLRRGRAYTHGANELDFICSHADEKNANNYICIPIVAHGDTIGLLHLVSDAFAPEVEADQVMAAEERKLALMCAEQISLAIANVRLRDQLHSQSIRDSLTGLYNRRHFNDACRKTIAAANRRGEQFGLISLDVDHFKLFNDNHGHDAGDMVLRAVGEALEQEFEGNDLPCRTGGEEFAILLPGLNERKTYERAEKLRRIVEAIVVRYGDHALPRITISAGVSIYPDHGDMPQALVKSADEALYEAKGRGRNQVRVARTDGDDDSMDLFADEDPDGPLTAYGIAAE